jgi:hypothetical protein
VGFRDFRGFLDGGDNRYGAKVAKGREGRGSFGVSEAALLKKLCVSAALREAFFALTVEGGDGRGFCLPARGSSLTAGCGCRQRKAGG